MHGMLADTTFDERQVLARPIDCAFKSLVQVDLRLKPKLALRFLYTPKTPPGMVPIALRENFYGRAIAGQRVDGFSQRLNGSFHPAGKVIDIARPPFNRKGQKSAHHIFNIDEIPAGLSTTLQWQRFAFECSVNKGRRYIPPNRGRCSTPSTSTENLSRSIYILKTRPHHRQTMTVMVIN